MRPARGHTAWAGTSQRSGWRLEAGLGSSGRPTSGRGLPEGDLVKRSLPHLAGKHQWGLRVPVPGDGWHPMTPPSASGRSPSPAGPPFPSEEPCVAWSLLRLQAQGRRLLTVDA